MSSNRNRAIAAYLATNTPTTNTSSTPSKESSLPSTSLASLGADSYRFADHYNSSSISTPTTTRSTPPPSLAYESGSATTEGTHTTASRSGPYSRLSAAPPPHLRAAPTSVHSSSLPPAPVTPGSTTTTNTNTPLIMTPSPHGATTPSYFSRSHPGHNSASSLKGTTHTASSMTTPQMSSQMDGPVGRIQSQRLPYGSDVRPQRSDRYPPTTTSNRAHSDVGIGTTSVPSNRMAWTESVLSAYHSGGGMAPSPPSCRGPMYQHPEEEDHALDDHEDEADHDQEPLVTQSETGVVPYSPPWRSPRTGFATTSISSPLSGREGFALASPYSLNGGGGSRTSVSPSRRSAATLSPPRWKMVRVAASAKTPHHKEYDGRNEAQRPAAAPTAAKGRREEEEKKDEIGHHRPATRTPTGRSKSRSKAAAESYPDPELDLEELERNNPNELLPAFANPKRGLRLMEAHPHEVTRKKEDGASRSGPSVRHPSSPTGPQPSRGLPSQPPHRHGRESPDRERTRELTERLSKHQNQRSALHRSSAGVTPVSPGGGSRSNGDYSHPTTAAAATSSAALPSGYSQANSDYSSGAYSPKSKARRQERTEAKLLHGAKPRPGLKAGRHDAMPNSSSHVSSRAQVEKFILKESKSWKQEAAPRGRRQKAEAHSNYDELGAARTFDDSLGLTTNYSDRAEIETPLPANVQSLKERLWDPSEKLHLSTTTSMKYHELRDDRQTDILDRTRVRVTRSLSPGTQRLVSKTMDEEVNEPKEIPTKSVGKETVFKSKFYEAAQRGMNSPTRSKRDEDRTKHQPTIKPNQDRISGSEVTSASRSSPDTNVASLVAKLSAVNRANPSAALAEIDEILRSESNSFESSRARQSATAKEHTQDDRQTARKERMAPVGPEDVGEDDGDDLSDESTVSSITNPTYQSSKPPSEHESPDLMFSKGKPRPSGLPSNTIPYTRLNSGSTFESGTPRPNTIDSSNGTMPSSKRGGMDSNVHAENNNATKVVSDSSNMEMVKGFTSVKDLGGGHESSADRGKSDSLGNEVAGMKGNADLQGRNLRASPTMNESEARASISDEGGIKQDANSDWGEKIRKWGQLVESNLSLVMQSPAKEGILDETEDLGSILTKKELASNANKRPHPWDSSIPARMGTVDLRNTSMESAAGIETNFTPLYTSSPDRSGTAPVRRMRKERISRELETLNSVDEGADALEQDPKVLLNQDYSGWEVTSRFTPLQQENVQSLSENFDQAWVNLPSTTYFRDSNKLKLSQMGSLCDDDSEDENAQEEMNDDEHPVPAAATMDDTLPTGKRSLEKFEPQASDPLRCNFPLYNPPSPSRVVADQRRQAAYDDAEIGAPSPARTFDSGIRRRREEEDDEEVEAVGFEVTLVQQAEPKRRGLRGLLSLRSNPKDKQSADTEPLNNSAKNKSGQRMSFGRRANANSADIARNAEARPDPGQRRGRQRLDPSPVPRGRARSLEDGRNRYIQQQAKIRNPNIAKKFSRLLRVYDDSVDNKVPFDRELVAI